MSEKRAVRMDCVGSVSRRSQTNRFLLSWTKLLPGLSHVYGFCHVNEIGLSLITTNDPCLSGNIELIATLLCREFYGFCAVNCSSCAIDVAINQRRADGVRDIMVINSFTLPNVFLVTKDGAGRK
jgi:hypothetical protein